MILSRRIIFYVLCLLVLTACPSNKKLEGLKTFKANKYDFSNFRKVYYKGVTTKIPKYFQKEYDKNHLIHSDGESFFIPEMSTYFSIERFDPEEVEDILFQFKKGTESLDAVHTNYADLRANSLIYPKVSLQYENYNTAKLKGFHQYIAGKDKYNYMSEAMYMFSTVEKEIKGKKHYFVVQLIAPKEFSKYLQDDFSRLIHNIH
ncbi:MAG: hypothetical protein ACK5B9_14700 [Flavobacteriia bacterium]|jgi:hypothetical protein